MNEENQNEWRKNLFSNFKEPSKTWRSKVRFLFEAKWKNKEK